MFRIRVILILVVVAGLVYWLMPASRKEHLRGKLNEIVRATVLAIILYWIYMVGALAWKQWGGQ
jgi:uncharacterized membrane protein